MDTLTVPLLEEGKLLTSIAIQTTFLPLFNTSGHLSILYEPRLTHISNNAHNSNDQQRQKRGEDVDREKDRRVQYYHTDPVTSPSHNTLELHLSVDSVGSVNSVSRPRRLTHNGKRTPPPPPPQPQIYLSMPLTPVCKNRL